MWDFTAGNNVPPTGFNGPASGYVPHSHAPSHASSHAPLRMPSPGPAFQHASSAPGGFPAGTGTVEYVPIPVAPGPSLHSAHSSHSHLSIPSPDAYGPTVIRGATPEPGHHHHHHHEHHSRPRAHSFSSPGAENLDRGFHLGIPAVIRTSHHHSSSHRHHHGSSGRTHRHSHSHAGQNYSHGNNHSGHTSGGQQHVAISRPVHLPSHPAYHPQFQYSKCTGRKKALCIGINYIGQPNELRGCINDAERMRDYLIHYHGFKPEDIVLLADNRTNPRQHPTRQNMLDGMRWLVRDACPNDSLFFQYSGHGGQTKDLDGDEIDGMDEVIYPVDFRKRGHIVDDEMHRIMVKSLPAGCRLTALFDSCHSGTVLDLPFIYSSHGRLKGNVVNPRALRRLASPADVISFSACKDGQKSVDTFKGGVAVGAMSYAFIKSLKRKPNQSYQGLLKDVREILYPKYTQKPQLGSSHHVDTGLRFVI